MKDQLLSKIHNHTATVAVIGLGYVGLPLAVAFAESGLRVVGIDVDPSKVDAIREGRSYISDIPSDRLARVTVNPALAINHSPIHQSTINHSPPSALTATTDYSLLAQCDVAIICVPTPFNKTRDPDVRFLIAAGESVAQYIHPGMLVVLESTTYPGTTEELLRPMLEAGMGDRLSVIGDRTRKGDGSAGVGVDFFLAFSPERIDPGRTDWTVENTPKVVGGVTPACLEVATALYQQAVDRVVPVSSPAAAEMTKLLENTFRAVNIALVNEVAIMCDKLGLDVWEVVDAAATKPYGFMKFTPGPGVGGHCIPLDPHYLSWKLKTLNYNARFIQLAGEINSDMPRYWVEKVVDAL
ncbi:MAG TPA: nucleotide sugar dehydrogenase, partial [Anaerolineae bacterium]|nr:nucleotide sugar dehydrogenase [Anaerolineae bacterium]